MWENDLSISLSFNKKHLKELRITRIEQYNSNTEKILTFSSELKMFLKIEGHF